MVTMAISQKIEEDTRQITLTWDTAYAGNEPLKYYEIYRDNEKIGRLDHRPQISRDPFLFREVISDKERHVYKVASVDFIDRIIESEPFVIESLV